MLLKPRSLRKIKKNIADNNLKVTTTSTGLNYVITKPGSGPLPSVGDTVYVNYTGRRTNGKVFDTSIKEIAVKEKLFNPMRPYAPIPLPVAKVSYTRMGSRLDAVKRWCKSYVCYPF